MNLLMNERFSKMTCGYQECVAKESFFLENCCEYVAQKVPFLKTIVNMLQKNSKF